MATTTYAAKCWGATSDLDNITLNLGPITAIAVGDKYACGVTPAGTVRCWTTASDEADYKRTVVPSSLGAVKALYAGMGEHTCAVQASGSTLVCWGGLNSNGELNMPASLGAVAAVAVAQLHNCAIKAGNGAVVCWGNNYYGESTVPADLKLPTTLVAASARDTCALDAAGKTRNWGFLSSNGILPPANLGIPQSLVGGGDAFCAINSTNAVVCWGLGTQVTVPATLADKAVNSVALGGDYACALTTDGSVSCWGTDNNNDTKPPSNLGPVAALSVAEQHPCVMTTTEAGEVRG